jgi:hypothetical protein
MKANEHNSPIIKEILDSVPLKMRLEIVNDMLLQTHLIKIGVIPDGSWSNAKEKKYGKLFRGFAKKLAKAQLDTFKQWEKDGKPK